MTKKDYTAVMKHKEGKKLGVTVEFFANLPYFRDRSIKQLQQLHFMFKIDEVPKNAIIYDIGQKSGRIYIVKEGEFEVKYITINICSLSMI